MIKNTTLFFVGIILLVVGGLVITFDYPQIRFLEGMEQHMQDAEIHQRLVIEFAVGIVILSCGTGMIGASFLNRFQNGIR